MRRKEHFIKRGRPTKPATPFVELLYSANKAIHPAIFNPLLLQ